MRLRQMAETKLVHALGGARSRQQLVGPRPAQQA